MVVNAFNWFLVRPWASATALAFLTGSVVMFIPEALSQTEALDEEALANIRLVARMQGFAAGAVAGWGFATALLMKFYKAKADAWDKFNEETAQAHIARLK